jgi:hypothetical protein
MHETQHPDVKGYIDSFCNKPFYIKGWCFHKNYFDCPVRFMHSEVVELTRMERPDVLDFYKTKHNLDCGWECFIDNVENFRIEMFFEKKWNIVYEFKKVYNKDVKFKNTCPSFVVVDNFYNNVDEIREFALAQKFELHPEYHKGKRTNDVFLFKGLKEKFETIVGKKIKNWTNGLNGCFQSCIGGDQLVYHVDVQEYAGIIFLTPNAPPEGGTTFYRSKHTKCNKINGDHDIVFKHGFLDSTEFEKVDVVGNVYNRLVLFDAKMIHAASVYFGNDLKNSRLFQMFFFDLE